MTRDEARTLIDTVVRNTVRRGFGVWRKPIIQRIADAVAFVAAVAADEWDLLENPPGPPKTEEELTIEALTEALHERGANGNSLKAARDLAAGRTPGLLAEGRRLIPTNSLRSGRRFERPAMNEQRFRDRQAADRARELESKRQRNREAAQAAPMPDLTPEGNEDA